MRKSLFVQSALHFGEADLFKYAQERGVKMPEDDSQWEMAITDHVASYLPYLTQYPVSVEFHEKEAKRGYAKGFLNVSNQLAIPLIIQNFRMLPLDVMTFENKFYPLSERMVGQILLPRNLASKPVGAEESKTMEVDMAAGNRPPNSAYGSGRNAGYKSSSDRTGGASILDRIDVQQEDLDSLKSRINNDEELALSVYQTSPQILHKLASRVGKRETVEDRLRKVAKAEGWPVNVLHIQKHANASGCEDFDVFLSSDYCPVAYETITIKTAKAVEMFGVEAVKQAMHGGAYTTVIGRAGSTMNTPEELNFPMQEMDKFGQYDAVSPNGRIVRGFFIPEVYNFNMQKQADLKLFTSKKEYALQEKIAGRAVTAGPSVSLTGDDICVGDTGSFVFRYGEKTAATFPLRVTSFPFISAEKIAFEAQSPLGEAFCIDVVPGIAAVSPGEKRGHYYVPSLWQWTKVGQYQEPLISDKVEMQGMLKAASDTCEHQIDIIWDGVHFNFRGNQVNNLSERMDKLEPMKARFLLTAFGMPLEYAEAALLKARECGKHTVYADIYPTGRYTVTTNAIERPDGSRETKMASDISEASAKIRSLSLTKEAFAGDTETVDSVLSLQFVTPQNIIQYVEGIDDLREATSKLASLLIASRLGMRPIDPVATKTAMENLSQVVEELEILRTSMMSQGKAQQSMAK